MILKAIIAATRSGSILKTKYDTKVFLFKRVIVKLKLYIWNDRTFLVNIPLCLWLVYVHVCCNTLHKNVCARQVTRAHVDVEYSDGKKKRCLITSSWHDLEETKGSENKLTITHRAVERVANLVATYSPRPIGSWLKAAILKPESWALSRCHYIYRSTFWRLVTWKTNNRDYFFWIYFHSQTEFFK